ncbi:unnamed protein product [Alternaria alternata]
MVVANRTPGTDEITDVKFSANHEWILDSANDLYSVGGDSLLQRPRLEANTLRSTRSKYTFVQKIFGQSHGKPPDANNIGQFALDFGTAERDAPVILNFTTQSQDTVERRLKMTNVDKLQSIFANRTAPAKDLETVRVAAQHALNSIAIVRAICDVYGCRAADNTLDARQTTYKGYIDAIDNWQAGAWDDVEHAHPPVPMISSSKDSQRPLETTDIQMPAASYAIIIGPAAGGDWGGNPFDNVPSNAILRRMRVIGIEVWPGDFINTIRTRVQ